MMGAGIIIVVTSMVYQTHNILRFWKVDTRSPIHKLLRFWNVDISRVIWGHTQEITNTHFYHRWNGDLGRWSEIGGERPLCKRWPFETMSGAGSKSRYPRRRIHAHDFLPFQPAINVSSAECRSAFCKPSRFS